MSTRVIFARGSLQISHYVFLATLLVRLVALARLTGSTLFRPAGGDMLFYQQWALRVIHGQWTDHHAFYALPLYAYWLAAIYLIAGNGAFLPLLIQAVADAGTAALVYKLSAFVAKTNNVIVGCVAAIGWTLYVPAQAYAAVLMPTSFAVFVFWFVVWQIVKTETAPTSLRTFLCALLLGFTGMAVANVMFAAVLVLVAVVVRPSVTRRRAQNVLMLCAGITIGTSPCWLHNCLVARDPVFLSAHGGVNFWIGNNREATGYPHFPGLHAGQAEMLRDSIAIAESGAGRPLLRSEVAHYWSSRAWSDITAGPLGWLRLLAAKFANFWSAFEYDDISVIDRLRVEHVIFPGPHFGVIAVLAIAGICVGALNSSGGRYIAAAIACVAASVLVVFVTERYRTAAVPGLLALGSIGLCNAWESALRRRYLRVAGYCASTITAAFVIFMPRADAALLAFRAYHEGLQAFEAGDYARAHDELERAYVSAPRNAETNLALGNLALHEHNVEDAKKFYRAAVALDPQEKSALNNLGVIALEEQEFPSAVTFFRDALRLEPQNAKTHYLLARALMATGQKAEAIREAETAIELDSAQPEFRELRERIGAQ